MRSFFGALLASLVFCTKITGHSFAQDKSPTKPDASEKGLALDTDIISYLFGTPKPKTKFETANWRVQSAKYLLRVDETSGKLVPLGVNKLGGGAGFRCPRLNNYWCFKNPGETEATGGWYKSIGRDADRHAIFPDAARSSAVMVRLMRKYYFIHNKKTPREIMCRFAPTDDCIGSLNAKNEDGSCQHGFNNCVAYAEKIASELKIEPDADAKIFDSRGNATGNMAALMRHMSNYEISEPDLDLRLYPRPSLVARGIALEKNMPKKPSIKRQSASKKDVEPGM
jgi:hypothetical protein